jgi:hypothetical protein
MAKYTFAIDETGSFTMAEEDPSFVCGVLISKDELTIKQKYQQAYKDFGLPEPIPNDTKSLIRSETFHFCSLTPEKKDICKKLLLPLADKVYVSKGKPTLYANNQNWWLVAVTVVISEFLKTGTFEQGDKVEVQIDNRNDETWGVIRENGDYKTPVGDEAFFKYHNYIKEQIKINISKIAQARGISIEIKFLSDTCSFFINLADVVCGFARKERKSILQEKIVDCSCSKYASNDDPAAFVDKNPITALSLIFQQISNDDLSNVPLLENNLLKKLRLDADNYPFAFDMFYDLLKSKIEERATNSKLVAIKTVVNVFLKEIRNANKLLLPAAKRLELMVLFTEYFSHIGDMEMPFAKDEFLEALKENGQNSETRMLRKWEKYISFSLHEAQVLFNGYRFTESVENFETIWGEQEKIVSLMPKHIFENEEPRDEPTTALIGTLAQSYAYAGKLNEAIDYFEMSKAYAIKTTKRTDSYLLTVYHRQGNIEKARECFFGQTGKTPEDYAAKKDFSDSWKLLSYCKLRALELYKNKSTNLPCVDLQELKNYNSEYPFPLIQKWEGIAAWFEDSQKNKQTVENYFSDAISNLLKDENGFTIKTLALPIIQCFAIVNNQNPFHAKYNNIISELKKQCPAFDVYVEKSASQFVIKNNKADIWERALLLPFIYA